jgi:DivIVA domain-containing protein
MEWIIAVVAVAALGIAAVAAAGGVGEMSRDPVEDVYRQELPAGPLSAEDIRGARFGTALRGYAMNQVDDLLERLATEIAERDARIAELAGVEPAELRPSAPALADSPARDVGPAA